MPISTLSALNELDASSWDALRIDQQPFLCHAFLSALEDSGSVGGRSGWQAAHRVLQDGQGRVLAAMPAYIKSHSYGEYVFDHGWADACHRAGIAYYPKLLGAIPFSPVSGQRLLGDPLAAGQDVLPTKHAYSHTIALSSGAQAYLHLGDEKYRKALVNAWTYMEPQRFASGGWGPEEQFVELHQGKLAASLKSSKAHFETPCGSFADMKLARYLVRFTGEPVYGDGLERTLYNTMLATRLPDSDGGYPYYSNYGAAAEKLYYHQKWPCCSGTLVQGVADYVLNLYFHDDNALVVNMFAPSTVKWDRPGGAVQVEQQTNYPAEDTTRLTVTAPGNGRFAMKLRIPAWAKGAQLRVNGAAQGVQPGTLAVIDRTWKAGDMVELTLLQALRTLSIDDKNPDIAAVMRGAVMYVGLNPWTGVEDQPLALPASLKPVPGSDLNYAMETGGRNLVFIPYFNVGLERYNTYFKIA